MLYLIYQIWEYLPFEISRRIKLKSFMHFAQYRTLWFKWKWRISQSTHIYMLLIKHLIINILLSELRILFLSNCNQLRISSPIYYWSTLHSLFGLCLLIWLLNIIFDFILIGELVLFLFKSCWSQWLKLENKYQLKYIYLHKI